MPENNWISTLCCVQFGNCCDFGRNFVKITFLLNIEVTKELIPRNFFFGEREFPKFPHYAMSIFKAKSTFFPSNQQKYELPKNKKRIVAFSVKNRE